MTLSIIIIGDEILLGRVTDTNSGLLARCFSAMGWQVKAVRTVGDDSDAIAAAVRKALDDSDLVISTGGLGPRATTSPSPCWHRFSAEVLKRTPQCAAT